ncbi:dUTP diphosphatase [Spiroplasma endosymbiont of Megaselia nigra]|uniref:dUTP diphosphatase n=1 Tax=Spiroplasma endosymbiont of Megaselia nigra TaxID=2478537 RepID=UPI000F860143|nr:dUTP diphosphatase [Spiroplasma endosymbiont of Megaselia nigra]RUO86671.1 dUTP diphosphatase [Spiroplasma endosymbiont of Megaselia nigra]
MLSNNTFNYLLENQKKLDKHILTKFNLNDNETFEKRILAFLVELAEFINEQRDFKYWSVKPASAKDILLEEYIDGIHFLISIGNSLTVDFKTYQYHNEYCQENINLTKLYLDCFAVAKELIKNQTSEVYFKVLNQYLIIAEQLKFTEDDLLTAYNKKNKINFTRQENNY